MLLYFDIYTLNLGAFSRKHMLMSTTQKTESMIYYIYNLKCKNKFQSESTQPMKIPLIPMSNKSYNLIVDILPKYIL